MARKKHDGDGITEIRNDVDCRAAKPKFKDGTWVPAKISDTTGGGLYLLVKPDPEYDGKSAAKLWQMAYRFHGRQKTYSIGPYGNDRDGGISLATARDKRDAAKAKLAQDPPVDPSIEKQFARHCHAAERPFNVDIDGWLAEKKTEKIKRGRLVVLRSADTNKLHAFWAGYLKARFGKLYRKDIKRPDVLAFFRSMQTEGKLETRDRVRSSGEQVCDWADAEGDGYNPFRAVKKQLTVNVSTPRPGFTEPTDVVRLFGLINQPRANVPFRDVVGDALRFDALTIPRPGMINNMEWREVDWDTGRWTIPAVKMKTGWDHVVPLSRQAMVILKRVQKITGNRRYVFSCADDEPLSAKTLCARLRALGIDTKTEHCAHGFRTTFSTLCHHEEHKEAKAWDGDVIELQLFHLESSTVKAIYKRHGPLALIGPRTKLMQHWADRADGWLDPTKVVQIRLAAASF
ncbi:tyrosine-type recombinase/integrase [Bradyrhizobium barranii subsp. barranii]|uniref:Tyrosine-type recombinase/integrase n=1 Tax=Bradyrhizobium barranii subsp. barranii TaxID=2823807 RepID=A0A7Z0TIL2_9BRAD|nr:site-specific integrase [Bradyrhizobium barranii]UGX96780.1 tyrosine-type recombinase/integrase [Bradyrhizobium barranii subsp. barranii]